MANNFEAMSPRQFQIAQADLRGLQSIQSEINAVTASTKGMTTGMNRASSAMTSFGGNAARGAITMENFGVYTTQAVKKVLVWQIAIMAVYGVMTKLGETIEIWKDLEVTLARIGITTGKLGDELYEYFSGVADVAVEFGMPIEQVLRGMDLSLRATAALSANEQERNRVATALLKTTSALVNITGMQYAQAIDILVGSLRQSNMGLDEGLTLLDKWVAVAKSAAVSVNDLSQGFAVMADAGRAAGLSVDQINALIAALSESVTLGPTQLSNAIRSIMATIYNPGSIAIMQKFGVAVRDSAGELRSVWDIMLQLSAMKDSDILSSSQWLEIAKAAGAGQRRYAQFLAMLNNMNTAVRIESVSAFAEQGIAMDANTRIVGTLVNAFDKLVAAQSELWYGIGMQGGLIEDLTGIVQKLSTAFRWLAGANDGLMQLGRAVMYVVGTLAALKLAVLAAGWIGLAPKIAGGFGALAGIAKWQVAGTAAAATSQAAGIAGAGIIGKGATTRAGLYALSGLIPGLSGWPRGGVSGWLSRKGWGAVGPSRPLDQGMGWAAPAQPKLLPTALAQRMSWGGVGSWATKGRGAGMGVGMGLASGAAAYAITKDVATAGGAAIAGGIGMALGGPVGWAAGSVIGGFIGKAFSDMIETDLDRTRKYFGKLEKQLEIKLSPEAEDFAEAVLEGIAPAEPTVFPFTWRDIKEPALAGGVANIETGGFWTKITDFIADTLTGMTGGAGGQEQERIVSGLEERWKAGLGIPVEVLQEALKKGVIKPEEFEDVIATVFDYESKIEGVGYQLQLIWGNTSILLKAYIGLASKLMVLPPGSIEYLETMQHLLTIEKQLVIERQALATDNRFIDLQVRINEAYVTVREELKGLTLQEWESIKVKDILSNVTRRSIGDIENLASVYGSMGYAYASHIGNVKAANDALDRMGSGTDIKVVDQPSFEQILRWEPGLYGQMVASLEDVASAEEKLTDFDLVSALQIGNAQTVFDNLSLTIDNFMAKIWEDPLILSKFADGLSDLAETASGETEKSLVSLSKRVLELYASVATGRSSLNVLEGIGRLTEGGFESAGNIKIIGPEEYEKYIKHDIDALIIKFANMLDTLDVVPPGETELYTIIDPITGLRKTIETNSTVWAMANTYIQENTKALKQGLEAEYNIPAGYAVPTRYMFYKTTGSTEFGAYHKTLADMFQEWATSNKDAIDDAIGNQTSQQTTSSNNVIRIGEEQVTVTKDILEYIKQLSKESWEMSNEGYKYPESIPVSSTEQISMDEVANIKLQSQKVWELFNAPASVDVLKQAPRAWEPPDLSSSIQLDESQRASMDTAARMITLNSNTEIANTFLEDIGRSTKSMGGALYSIWLKLQEIYTRLDTTGFTPP